MTIIAETQPGQVHNRGGPTKFNGVDGEYGKFAALWLVDMESHRQEGSSPSTYLIHLDSHLEGEAARWVLNTPVGFLINKAYKQKAINSDVEAFYRLLRKRFQMTDDEASHLSGTTPEIHLQHLSQGIDEGLDEYYNRALLLINVLGDDGESVGLTPLQRSVRIMVLDRFINGLRYRSQDSLVWRLFKHHILHHTVSLRQAFKMAEAEIRMMDLEQEMGDRKMKEQAKKRKLAADAQELANAKKQKHIVPISGPPAATDDDDDDDDDDVRRPGRRSVQAKLKAESETKPESESRGQRYSLRSDRPS